MYCRENNLENAEKEAEGRKQKGVECSGVLRDWKVLGPTLSGWLMKDKSYTAKVV